MKLQLYKLVIWPKNTRFPPREVTFHPGRLNVITGASRTGKSAIIPIIDYCLGSSDCQIPIDTIRTHASWYGIVAETDSGRILLARRVPNGKQASDDFLMREGTGLSVPPVIEGPSHKLVDVKLRLNILAHTPSFKLNEDDQGYTGRLSFRDIMALVFQSQDIMANQNILFYKTHDHDHRERLRNWFPFILGAETLEMLRARNRLKVIENELRRVKREYAAATEVSKNWLDNLTGHLRVADEYGLLNTTIGDDASVPELVNMAKEVLDAANATPQLVAGNITRATTEIGRLDKEDEELGLRIGALKKRMSDLKRLKDGFTDYGGAVRRRSDRLHISRWLKDVAQESAPCPVCGSAEHPRARRELAHICSALEHTEATVNALTDVPTAFTREEEALQQDLESVLEERKSLQQRFDLVISRDQEAQQELHRRKEMHEFVGHLRASLEMFERLTDGGDLSERIGSLEREQAELGRLLNQSQVNRDVNAATAQIAQKALVRLNTLDVEDKYRRVAPRFDTRELGISVLSDDRDWHFLAEVGSASNWVSFHIALMCGLQEFFLGLPGAVVPNFAVFDQPSQVYFPRASTNGEGNDDPKYEKDQDVEAVRCMFRTMASSIAETGNGWQAIVLDHADNSVYGQVPGVTEVANWRGGDKLIPQTWIDEAGSETQT